MFSGTTSLGHDFGHLYTAKRWKECVEDPLTKFAEKVYRKQCALFRDFNDISLTVLSQPLKRAQILRSQSLKTKPLSAATSHLEPVQWIHLSATRSTIHQPPSYHPQKPPRPKWTMQARLPSCQPITNSRMQLLCIQVKARMSWDWICYRIGLAAGLANQWAQPNLTDSK